MCIRKEQFFRSCCSLNTPMETRYLSYLPFIRKLIGRGEMRLLGHLVINTSAEVHKTVNYTDGEGESRKWIFNESFRVIRKYCLLSPGHTWKTQFRNLYLMSLVRCFLGSGKGELTWRNDSISLGRTSFIVTSTQNKIRFQERFQLTTAAHEKWLSEFL